MVHLLIALLHTVPIFLTAYYFKSKQAVVFTAVIMSLVAIGTGRFEFISLDLSAVWVSSLLSMHMMKKV